MPPPPALPGRPFAVLGGALVCAGLAWAILMPMERTLICSGGTCRQTDAGLLTSATETFSLLGARVVQRGEGERWLAVIHTSSAGERLLGFEPAPTQAEAAAPVAELNAWRAGKRPVVLLHATRPRSAYGLPALLAGLGLALLLLAAVVGSWTSTAAAAKVHG